MIAINQYIDHTLLKATATEKDVTRLCQEAIKYEFFSVCVNSAFVGFAKQRLLGTRVKICSVVGFPLGAMSTAAKIFEAEQAIRDGASEIDMVLNIGALKAKHFDEVEQEIKAIKKAIGKNLLKVILETCYLSAEEILKGSELSERAQADYIKTSTGFGPAGADRNSIILIKKAISGKVGIKASGGIKDLETALSFIELEVDRIGTSSGVSIVQELAKCSDSKAL